MPRSTVQASLVAQTAKNPPVAEDLGSTPSCEDLLEKAMATYTVFFYDRWITEKAREFQKNSYFCFIDYTKAFDCVDHKKLWKILKEMGIPDHLISNS